MAQHWLWKHREGRICIAADQQGAVKHFRFSLGNCFYSYSRQNSIHCPSILQYLNAQQCDKVSFWIFSYYLFLPKIGPVLKNCHWQDCVLALKKICNAVRGAEGADCCWIASLFFRFLSDGTPCILSNAACVAHRILTSINKRGNL